MHEMSIALDIITTVENEMKAHKVHSLKSIKMKVGELTAVEPDSLKFCLESAIDNTPLEGAKFYIEEIPFMGRCKGCACKFRLEKYFSSPCPNCGEKNPEIISGRELDIVSMEAE